MIRAEEFLQECRKLGFDFFTGTPCSYLKSFINYVIDHKEFRFVDATNEGDAVAIAAGAALCGKRSVVMFQNSGLGNAVNPITSLNAIFQIPMLIITTLRGDPVGAADEPQHLLMGSITTELLDTMEVSWSYFPSESSEISSTLEKADQFMKNEGLPFALVMKKDAVNAYELQSSYPQEPHSFTLSHTDNFSLPYEKRSTRNQALQVIRAAAKNQMPVIATTGKTGRELYELEDSENQFYMVGSMGCALPFGLGVALNYSQNPVCVIDGDGALLMRTGSMATVGAYAPKNLLHILLDNEAHDSTGGQSTVSHAVSFAAIAKAFNYKNVYSTDQLECFQDYLQTALVQQGRRKEDREGGPTFIHFKIRKGSPKELGRPKVTPLEVGLRFSKFLRERQSQRGSRP